MCYFVTADNENGLQTMRCGCFVKCKLWKYGLVNDANAVVALFIKRLVADAMENHAAEA